MDFADIHTIPILNDVFKIFFTGILAFVVAFFFTPFWTNILYKYKIGTKIKKTGVQGDTLTHYSKIHAVKSGTPTMGGVIVWFSVVALIFASHFLFPYFAVLYDTNFIARLDFLTDKQTVLPLFVLLSAGVLGLFDDVMSVRGWGSNKGGGMRFIMRFWWVILIALISAWWYYVDFQMHHWDEFHIPGIGDFALGFWFVPLFVFVLVYCTFSSNETDGLDGLNAGVLLIAFSSFALIAFVQNQVDLAAFCSAIAGALLAFLWFNIYPARFFMGDTGAVGLGATLGVVAIMTNSVIALFIIVFIYALESGSAFIQILSKRHFGRKIFLAAPIHHHFEALGWPEPKIVMRAWVFTALTAGIGILVAIFGGG